MNKITLQEQFEFLGVETLGELIIINTEQDEIVRVENSIDISCYELVKSGKLSSIEIENETVTRYVKLCESNGLRFVLNRYLTNGFSMSSYSFKDANFNESHWGNIFH
jgi:hypothetical protein